jgi:dTDP-4-dehydrorhamnose reductase
VTHCLVLGARGKLGLSLLACARARGVRASGFAGDIAEPDDVARALDDLQPDCVVNAAAFTAVDRCESEPERAWRANAVGPGVVARACAPGVRLVHVSTDYVFAGEPGARPREDTPPQPLNEYGRSKLAGERAVQDAGGEHLIARTQWLFGPGPSFVETVLERAAQGEPLRVVRDEVGRPTWTDDLAGGLLDVAAIGLRGTLHLANQGEASRWEFACEVVRGGCERGWNRDVPVEPIERCDLGRPAIRPGHAVLDLGRALAAGIELPPWRDALRRHLDQRAKGERT